MLRTAEGLRCRPGPVGRQVQHMSGIAQLVSPVRGLLLESFSLKSLPLPSCKIRILNRQLQCFPDAIAGQRSIRVAEFAVEHYSRRNIPSNVMGEQQQPVPVICEAN